MTKAKTVRPEPTAEQLAELAAYAVWAGAAWRMSLINDWMRAGSRYPGEWHPLQQLRNQQGPSWLAAFEFPEIAS